MSECFMFWLTNAQTRHEHWTFQCTHSTNSKMKTCLYTVCLFLFFICVSLEMTIIIWFVNYCRKHCLVYVFFSSVWGKSKEMTKVSCHRVHCHIIISLQLDINNCRFLELAWICPHTHTHDSGNNGINKNNIRIEWKP